MMDKEELLKELEKLPKVETNNPISTMNGINIDDLMSAVDRLNKVPTYDELLRENKKQKKAIDKAIEYINGQIISYDFEEDSGVDCECDGFKLLDILKGVSNNE